MFRILGAVHEAFLARNVVRDLVWFGCGVVGDRWRRLLWRQHKRREDRFVHLVDRRRRWIEFERDFALT